jgi:predicted nucleic acid-binding protein
VSAIFVDTFYWIARIDPHDQWHQPAKEISASLGDSLLLTTESVLIELLNYFSNYGPDMRQAAGRIIRLILSDPQIEVLTQPRAAFLSGLTLFEARLDKGYSLTDTIAMQAMRERGLTTVLTHDHHFAQEGFIVLL